MKKRIAIVLAIVMLFSLSVNAFAYVIGSGAAPAGSIGSGAAPAGLIGSGAVPRTQQNGGWSNNQPSSGGTIIHPGGSGSGGTLAAGDYVIYVNDSVNNLTYDSGLPVFYNYGPAAAGAEPATGGQKARIILVPDSDIRIVGLKAYCDSKNLSVSAKRNTGSVSDPSVITLKGSQIRPNSLKYANYTVTIEMQVADERTGANRRYIDIQLSADESAAYSKIQELSDGDRLTVSSQNGCVFYLNDYYTSSTRIRCNEDATVYVKGRYGGSLVNMRVDTSEIASAQSLFPNSLVRFYNFVGTPKFTSSVMVELPGGKDSNVYTYNSGSGAATKVKNVTYSDGSLTFVTNTLGWYFVADGAPTKYGK